LKCVTRWRMPPDYMFIIPLSATFFSVSGSHTKKVSGGLRASARQGKKST